MSNVSFFDAYERPANARSGEPTLHRAIMLCLVSLLHAVAQILAASRVDAYATY